MPRKEHKTTPKVVWQTLYTDSVAVSLESPAWFDWLVHNTTCYFEWPGGPCTARREVSGGGAFWYAFRRHRGKRYNAYLGRTADLTHTRLLAVAEHVAEKVSRCGVPSSRRPVRRPSLRGGHSSSGSGGQRPRMP